MLGFKEIDIAIAEAEVMRAKGYTEKDVIQEEVQKAYAEGIGNMNISGAKFCLECGKIIRKEIKNEKRRRRKEKV